MYRPYVDDGALYVGYGLSTTEFDGLEKEAFDEMIANNRFQKIW
ncbi:MAG: hypothetical protein RQ714_02945 [Nitrosomonas sp.]|nr:hypothetical protein [Nitrosomonas sp.]